MVINFILTIIFSYCIVHISYKEKYWWKVLSTSTFQSTEPPLHLCVFTNIQISHTRCTRLIKLVLLHSRVFLNHLCTISYILDTLVKRNDIVSVLLDVIFPVNIQYWPLSKMETWMRRTLTLTPAAHCCVLKSYILPAPLHFGICVFIVFLQNMKLVFGNGLWQKRLLFHPLLFLLCRTKPLSYWR